MAEDEKEMEIQLISVEDVQKRRGRTKGEKYGRYAQAIAHQVQWFKDRIEESPCPKEGDIKSIRMKIRDVAKAMGPEFEQKSDKAIYWGLRFVLFHEGIVVTTGKTNPPENAPLLVMRYATDKDTLPPSLSKVLEPSEEEMPELGSE